ncbi:response regulator [Paraburkholderia sp. JHI869]|uniref:response regulator n=1 Tax=Paraburkholderia sp. JHI869 TaxID=3112959 RepID=UPI0031788867
MLVDDNREVADALAALVEFNGHDAQCAADGHEALLVAASFLPEIAFVDWKLPDMSGGELVGQLRLNPALANTRYVLLSGHIDPDIVAKAAAAGFDKCLMKPVRFEDLLDCL